MSIPGWKMLHFCLCEKNKSWTRDISSITKFTTSIYKFFHLGIKYLFKIMNSASDLIKLHLVELLKEFQAAKFVWDTSRGLSTTFNLVGT